MKSDCLAIIMAYEGNAEMFRDIFGAGEQPVTDQAPEPDKLPPLTQGAFRLFGKKG